jgi:hypothetical protein
MSQQQQQQQQQQDNANNSNAYLNALMIPGNYYHSLRF